MVAIRSRFVSFLLLLAVLAVSVLAFGLTTPADHDMRTAADGLVIDRHVAFQKPWLKVQPSVPLPTTPGFLDHAFEDAQRASVYVGTHKPSGFMRLTNQQRQIYYYSRLKPVSLAGRQLNLPADNIAMLLWKYDVKSKKHHLLNIDFLKYEEIPDWNFYPLQYLLEQH